jgi:hypothetical protein
VCTPESDTITYASAGFILGRSSSVAMGRNQWFQAYGMLPPAKTKVESETLGSLDLGEMGI